MPPEQPIGPAPRIQVLCLRGAILLVFALLQTNLLGDKPGGNEDVLVMPELKVSANVPITKVAEYHMREKRFGATAVLSDWYIYIIGGQSAYGTFARTIERFDAQTGESIVFSALSVGRLWPRAAMVGNNIYIMGGASSPAVRRSSTQHGAVLSAKAQIADATRPPEKGEPKPADVNELYPEQTIEVLNIDTGAITILGDMPNARIDFGMGAVGENIYVIGGKRVFRRNMTRPNLETVTNRVEIFNTTTGKWSAGVNRPNTSTADAVVLGESRIVCTGGFTGSGKLDTVLVFDVATQAWSNLSALERPTSAHSTVFLDKYLFLFGDYDRPDEILVYNLRDYSSAIFTLRYTAARHAAAVANATRIFVIGGKRSINAESLDTIQVFQLTSPKETTPRK